MRRISADKQRVPQPMRPTGIAGRLFGFVMERVAAPNYRWVLQQLAQKPPRSCREIGFGTGRLMREIARKFEPARLAGVDPSELMLATATKRLAPFGQSTVLDLRLGDAAKLDWPAESFDSVIASHSFQFWADPASVLGRIHDLIAAQGRLLLVVRNHARSTPDWVPNPITRSGRELEGLRAALMQTGFQIVADEKLKTGSQGIEARKAYPSTSSGLGRFLPPC